MIMSLSRNALKMLQIDAVIPFCKLEIDSFAKSNHANLLY